MYGVSKCEVAPCVAKPRWEPWSQTPSVTDPEAKYSAGAGAPGRGVLSGVCLLVLASVRLPL